MKHLTLFAALGLSAILLAISGCSEEEVRFLVPAGGGSGAVATNSSSGSAPLAPGAQMMHAVEETHGVTSPDRCDAMAEKFRRQGRRVTLKEKRSNPSGGVLTWICVFTGEDATPGYFDGDR